MTKLAIGDRIPTLQLTTIHGDQVSVPDPGHVVHLQFRRFAGCPICNRHLHDFLTRRDAIASAGVREVVLFHSEADKLRRYDELATLDVVADPSRTVYDQFGVERSAGASFHPKALGAGLKGLAGGKTSLRLDMGSGIGGLPADLLIDPDGVVLAAHYGRHADDAWSVDEVLELSAGG
jgi:peroxiredoxin